MALNLNGKIGGVDKKIVVGGGVLIVGILGVVYYRSKKQAAASAASSSATTVTDPAGNVCAALNPASGYCPGTEQDLAYTQGNMTALGTDASSYVGGQIIGYDQYGNPIYSSSPTQTGVPGGFTNNAQWAQAAQTYLTSTEPSADPATIANAIGSYITGNAITADQQQLVEQAIAFEGYPPVGGTNGFPPSIKTSSGTGTPPPPPTTSKPGAPSGITISEGTKGTFDVAWKPGKNATSYNLAISPAPLNGSSGSHNIGARTQYNISGIQSGKTYTVTVNAENSAGTSAGVSKSLKGK